MPEVFISYRQTSDTERQRVWAFAERLRARGISVILDQFLLDAKAGGPPEDWAKWSTDQANQTERVIIIGSESWFLCYDGKQPPGTGLGAACEARNLRRRIYRNAGINEDIRVVIFDEADAQHISADLELYHRFHADRDFDNIIRWLKETKKSELAEECGQKNKNIGSHSPAFILLPTKLPRSNLPTIQRFFGRDTELAKLLPDLHPDATGWGALIDGPGGMGKTTLAIRAAELAAPGHYDDILFLSAKQTAMDPHGPHDESPFAVSGFTQMLDAIARRLQKPEITQAPADERPRLLIDALTGTRTLLVLDNLETLTDADQRSLFAFLGHLPRTSKARPAGMTNAECRMTKLQRLRVKAPTGHSFGQLHQKQPSKLITATPQFVIRNSIIRHSAMRLPSSSSSATSSPASPPRKSASSPPSATPPNPSPSPPSPRSAAPMNPPPAAPSSSSPIAPSSSPRKAKKNTPSSLWSPSSSAMRGER